MRRLAGGDDECDGIELFGALLDYHDQLFGAELSGRPLPPSQLASAAAMITVIRTEGPGGSASTRQDQRRDQDHDVEQPSGVDPGALRRLDGPVNASVTLAQGRELAERLADADDWQAELGDAIKELYSYLDQLHGGSFIELLNSAERRRVAAALADSVGAISPPRPE